MRIQDGDNSDPGSEMGKSRIRDGKKSFPGSGINIPDPQHWIWFPKIKVEETEDQKSELEVSMLFCGAS